MSSLRNTIATVALTAMAAVPMATAITILSADGAYAQGNGNGGGNGNAGGNGKGNASGNDRGQDVAAANRGGQRGRIASELGALNAAHASQTALENASPDSMPGRLYSYQQTGGITVEDILARAAAQEEVTRLESLTEAEILSAYDADGSGDLDDTETLAYQDDISAAKATTEEYAEAYASLAALGEDGQLTLSADALEELNAMLGL